MNGEREPRIRAILSRELREIFPESSNFLGFLGLLQIDLRGFVVLD